MVSGQKGALEHTFEYLNSMQGNLRSTILHEHLIAQLQSALPHVDAADDIKVIVVFCGGRGGRDRHQ